ncbi:MAG: hypothetical protein JWP94_582 [Mucilaginibacter sp.]|nr:hypothetical protein [Mucilaginibacter sp.]
MDNFYSSNRTTPVPFQEKKISLWTGNLKKTILRGGLTCCLFLLIGFQTVSAHAVQVGYVILPNGFIRVYIEHWHGALSEAGLQGNGMSITTTYGSTTITQNVNPTGAFNGYAWNNLPGAGTKIIILAKTSYSNMYNDWAYYDFPPAACNVPVNITLNGGLTVVLTESEPNVWPQTISGTFVDTSPPTITPANTTVSVACGTAGANVNFSATSVDNCTPNLTASFSIAPGSFFPIGTTNVTATSTDANGNKATLIFPVTVNVTPLPPSTISASGPTTFCQGGVVTLTASAGASYLWSTGATTPSISAGTAGNYSVIVTQATGCSAASAATAITVKPLPVATITASGPTAFCQSGSVKLTASAGASYHWSTGATTQSITVNTAGDYTVTVTNTGGCSTTSSATAVTVNPFPTAAITASGPTTFCPTGSVTLTAGAGASYLWSTGATTPSINATSTGNYTVTVTNDSGCSATSAPTAVLVQDLVNPVFTSTQANTIVAVDATTGTAALTDYTSSATVTDNCSVSSITQFPLAGTALANNVPVTVTLTATDPSGNSATQSFTVTATDQTAPVAATKNITVSLDASGNVSITAAAVDNGSTDNVGITTYSLDKTTFDCTNVGANTVNLTLSDAAGNTSTASAVVTVQDNVPPIAIAQAITVQLDATGNAVITAAQINNGSTDNCAIATYSLDKTTFDCSNVGANTVTLTVTDTHGNASTATAVVTVQDNVPPVVIAQNITVQLDAIGNAVITAAQVNNGSTDNCAIATYTLDKSTFDCSNVGANTVTLTVTDIHGNASTATAVVSIQDNVPPIAIAQAVTVQLDATGKATITPAQINNNSTDNCAISTYALDKATFDCSNVGANTVTLTVTDIHGNASTATAVVTVQDNIKPIAIAQNITVQLDATGKVTITPLQVNNGSTDNCAIADYALDKISFDCSNVGTNNVTLTVTDTHGNASIAPAVVTVQDNVPPVVLTKNITVYLSGGNATITPAQIDNGSNDACGIKSISLNKTTFDCSTQGANTVTLTVTDNHGNVSTGTAVVTVIGKTPNPAIAVSRTDNTGTKLDANTIALGYGAQKLTLTASNPNSAPGASTYKWSPSAGLSNSNIANPVFTPTQAGSYTFNVLVTSEYGCQASASVTIIVIDARCGGGDKVSVCHNTGSASNPYTQLCISSNAVATQLANGGTLGTCSTTTLAKTRMLELNIPEAPKVVTLIAYPNPFGKRTTVSFTVPSAEQNVTLEVYDSMGRKVATLYSGRAEANQTYSYPFDGTRLLFGVYFVRLTTSTGAYTFRLSMLE